MKISLNWLKNYVDLKISSEKLAYLLNMAGLGVEKQQNVDGDTVFEVEVTPNRPDCLSYLGCAREVSAVLNKPFKIPAVKEIKKTSGKVEITIENKNDCARYIGAIIKDLSIQPSPAWLTKNLNSIGSRSINNVVDITNFCLMEQGQPLHAFDYDKLIGGKITVRRAKAGETIRTIDGVDRKLDPSILVIADEKRPVAIAGIMGGQETEVTAKTKNILLESAYFDPGLIRSAGRKLGLSSDSSYRFERRVNFERVKNGALRALALISELAGGKIQAYTDKIVINASVATKPIILTGKYIEDSLGTKVLIAKCKNILQKLGFKVVALKDQIKVFPTIARADIKIEADIVEEIARIIGYDQLPATLPKIRATNIPLAEKRNFRQQVVSRLLSLGLDEIVTYTLTSQKNLEKTNATVKDIVRIQNPLSQDQEILRPSLLPSFLPVIQANLNRGQKDLKLFEATKVYSRSGEQETLGILLTGISENDWRRQKKSEVDFFDLKGIIEKVFEIAGIEKAVFQGQEFPFLDGAQSVVVKCGNETIGHLGKISAVVLNQWDIRAKKILFAELNLDKILAKRNLNVRRFEPVPEFPAVVRDISLAVKKDVTFDQIHSVIRSQTTPFLSSVRLLEEYVGEKISEGQRGLILSLVYQSPSRTLREEEVSEIHNRITQALIERLDAVRR